MYAMVTENYSPGEVQSIMSYRFSILYKLAASLAAVLVPATAFAYVGPGAGITAIGSVLALLVGVFMAIVGFIWYPIKRMIRGKSGKAAAGARAEKNTAEETGAGNKPST